MIPLRRRVLYSSALVLGLLLLVEGIAQVAMLRMYSGRLAERDRLHEYHPILGWANIASHRVADRFGAGRHATHSSRGFRGAAEYTPAVPDGRYRILFFGDSFTYGIDVGDDGTFPAQLQALCPTIESVNLGVAGYGIDQMYLSFVRETSLKADLVVFAFIEDDFHRMGVSAFLTKNPKPRLVLRRGALETVNVPVPTWGDASRTSWFRAFPDRTAFVQLLRKVLDTHFGDHDVLPLAERVFHDIGLACRRRGQELVLVYLPSPVDLVGGPPPEVSLRVAEMAARLGIPLVNLTGAFFAYPPGERETLLFKSHYSTAGQRLVAEELLKALRRQLPNSLFTERCR